MAKANQKTNKDEQLKIFNNNFDTTADVLQNMADKCEDIMPLVSSSLEHTIKLVKMYKKAFNAGFEDVKRTTKRTK